ncbi:leucyl aminopeptidase family protein [Tianweitania sediminis]|uniref:Leucyl aminopeptidase family protein n=1 Tax=Tianweitania sediminis TaxID=1502156 RepID=A0A8J7R0Y3_9HYPH|nr:leucyl aminopeptidase family protein [Tianweitania sediminis]MBP0440573.1 leucyl aminopeptidase family protein [Tianweitania sediminis]
MPVELASKRSRAALPVYLVGRGSDQDVPELTRDWARLNDFTGEAGRVLLIPGDHGRLVGALCGVGSLEDGGLTALSTGALSRALPEGDWYLAPNDTADIGLATLGVLLGGYAFTRYGKKPGRTINLFAGGADRVQLNRIADGVFLARDLINTPANDMGPAELEDAAQALAKRFRAKVEVTKGDALLKANFPMIHAVGRASAQAPRLIDLSWGKRTAPKVTLVGKGVCFDTGGLDLKPASNMLLMKKDMGGAANVLGLASMLMAAKLNIRLRVLIPAVENAVSANAFRPSDVLQSRKGISVEVGNTDAEGRLVLADALALADEESPDLLIDMATLTGAARVALGPEVPPFFTDDTTLAFNLASAAEAVADPLWRLPLYKPYASRLSSKIADTNNVNADGMAGAVTAALFLKKFVEKAHCWAHFDIYGWCPSDKPHCPTGGEAQGIRALEHYLTRRFGSA